MSCSEYDCEFRSFFSFVDLTQLWYESQTNELRLADSLCLDMPESNSAALPRLMKCHGSGGSQTWKLQNQVSLLLLHLHRSFQYSSLLHVNQVNYVLKDVKYASGIENIHFRFYPYTPMCVSTEYLVLSLSSVKKITGILLGWDSSPRSLQF